MDPPPTNPYRERYDLLQDRRRLGFEIERLRDRIVVHPRWDDPPEALGELLAHATEVPLTRAIDRASNRELFADVRRLTERLVALAKIHTALERGRMPTPDEIAPDG